MGSSLLTKAAYQTPPHLRTLPINRPSTLDGSISASVDTPLPIRALGDYELLDTLGRGGMGIVYLARQCGLKRKVAYKVLTRVGEVDSDALERFRSEAETLGRLQHSGIVQVYDSGSEQGNPFLAMEYVAGGSLADRIRIGRTDPREAAKIIATVADAVGHAHSHGIIHRDLKPANILLTPEGQPKVADFGLARDMTSDHLTRTGLIAGTPTYMPPEQLTGVKDLTPAIDVWATGVLLYELITGTVPFAGSDPQQILMNILRHEAVSLRQWQPNLPRDLDTICGKCLQKEPHRRYANGTELAADLKRFLEGTPILARPIGRIEKCERWCRRNPWIAASMAAVAFTLVAATSVSLLFAQSANEERTKAIAAAKNEHELREQAVLAAEAEKKSREAAEKAFAAEKQARTEAEALTTMMVGLIKVLTPAPGVDLVQQFLDKLDVTSKSLETGTGDPLFRARLLDAISMTYQNIGMLDKMLGPMAQVVALREKHLPPNDPLVRDTKIRYGYLLLHHPGRGQEALRIMKPALEMNIESGRADRKYVIGQMGMLRIAYGAAGDDAEARRLSSEIVELCNQEYGPDHLETLWMTVNHPKYLRHNRNYEEAIPLYTRALRVFKENHKSNSMYVMWTQGELGKMLVEAKRFREAVPHMKDTYELQYQAHGLRHPFVGMDRNYLLVAMEGAKMYAEELPLRWTYFEEANAAGDWRNTISHGWRFVRDCFWRYRR